MTPRMLSMGTLAAATANFAPVAPSGQADAFGVARPSERMSDASLVLAREWDRNAFSTGVLLGACSVLVVIGGAVALRSLRSPV